MSQPRSARAIGAVSLAACLFVMMAPGLHAATPSINDVAPPLREVSKCMFRVLRATPGVDHAQLGVSDSDGWVHPYLEYRAKAEQGSRPTIRFDAVKQDPSDSASYVFLTLLVGLVPPGEARPPDHGTGALIRRWRTECGANVNALFV